MRKFLNLFCVLAGLFLHSACENTVQRPVYADLTFAHKSPIFLDVAEIEFRSDYKRPFTAPNVEHELPLDITGLALGWARDRLKAVGQSGKLIFVVTDASVLETALEKTGGLAGLFTIDQSEKYKARIAVSVNAENLAAGRMANTRVEISRSQTVAEDATLNQREAIWYGMIEKMAIDLDAKLEQNITRYLAAFITHQTETVPG